MSTYGFESTDYERINMVAPRNGIVLMGGTSDMYIPVSELGRAFEINEEMLNRSVIGFKVSSAAEYYRKNVREVEPEAVILHVGKEDRDMFDKFPARFDADYRAVLTEIRKDNPKCRIGVVSINNPGNDSVVEAMNSHIKAIADSERCEYFDIEKASLWNPNSTKAAITFANAMGLTRFKIKRPLRDIAKIIYGSQGEKSYETSTASEVSFGRVAFGNA